MRHLAFLVILASLPALTATPSVAGDTWSSPLHVKLEREPVNFIAPRFRAYVTADSNWFAFRLPEGYRLSGDPASGTLTLANREGNGSVTFSVAGAMPADAAGLNPDYFRDTVSHQYPNATIAQEFWRNNTGGGGPGFDLQWKAAGQLIECKRVIYVSSPAGVLQFTATGSRTNFTALQSDLDAIILSFQCTTNGTKPKLPPLLDHS